MSSQDSACCEDAEADTLLQHCVESSGSELADRGDGSSLQEDQTREFVQKKINSYERHMFYRIPDGRCFV